MANLSKWYYTDPWEVKVDDLRLIWTAACAGLLGGIEGRRKRPEYARLLTDCHQIYCEMRMLVMGPIVRDRVGAHAEAALTALMRSGCSYLLQVNHDSTP